MDSYTYCKYRRVHGSDVDIDDIPTVYISKMIHFDGVYSDIVDQSDDSKTSYLSHPEDQHFFSGSMKSRSGSRVGVSGSFLDITFFLNIIFVRIEIQSFLKFFRIEVSDWFGGVLSSWWASGSKSPNDWGRMFLWMFPKSCNDENSPGYGVE